jgi:hypothetical protein
LTRGRRQITGRRDARRNAVAQSTHHRDLELPGRTLCLVGLALLASACGSSAASTPASHNAAAGSAAPTVAPSLAPAGSVTATLPSLGALSNRNDYYSMAADGTSVWIDNAETGLLTRVGISTGTVTARVQLRPGCSTGRGCGSITVAAGAVWVANDVDGTITRVDTATATVVATVHVAANASPQVFATSGGIWTANYYSDSFSRIDPASNTVVATLSGHANPSTVVEAAGSIWLCDEGGDPGLTRLDAHTYAVQGTVSLKSQGVTVFCAGAVPLGDHSLYVLPTGDPDGSPHAPLVVDALTGRTTQAPAPGPRVLTVASGATAHRTWVLDLDSGLYRVDSRNGALVAHTAVSNPAGMVDDGTSVWVMSSDGVLSRITPSS